MKAAIVLLCVVGLAVASSSFDARQKWPKCVQTILNQGQCGSCWAFAANECFADRMCIQGDTGLVISSPEPCIDCTRNACNGNTADTAWKYLINHGSTSCTNECQSGCAPTDSAAHGKPNACHDSTCDNSDPWPVTWKASSYKMLKKGSVSQYEDALSGEGPLQSWFQVYESFYSFFDANPTGIYTKSDVSGSYEGNHFIKFVGYGSSSGTNYWICANSWGPAWGDAGYFKMEKGVNLCGIETYVYEGFAQGQATRELTSFEITNHTESPRAGHWVSQEDLSSSVVADAASAAVELLNAQDSAKPFVFKKVLAARTQVVAGLNVNLHVEMMGVAVDVTLFRDLKNVFHLQQFDVLF